MRYLLPKNQRGMSQLGVSIVVVVVLLLGGIGYVVYNKSKDNHLSASDKTIRAAIKNSKCSYDDQDICKFFAGRQISQSYTVASTRKASDTTTTSTLKSQDDDKTQLRIIGNPSYETITIGTTLYTKSGDVWYKQTITPADLSKYRGDNNFNFSEPAKDNAAATKTAYKKIGKEKCGDLTCFKYQIIESGDATTYIWFDDAAYRLRRTQAKSADGRTEYNATLHYAALNITAPSPIKELAANQHLDPGQTEPITLPATGDQPPTAEEIQQYIDRYGHYPDN